MLLRNSVLTRLRERKLVQWALAYLAGAWVLLQVAGELRDTFGWPPVIVQVLTVMAAAGLPIVAVLAWYHGERGEQRVSGPELLMLAALLVIAGGVVSLVDRGGTGAIGNPMSRSGVAPGAAAFRSPAPVEQSSIAVLPFADMSPGKDQEYFSDGITEELLNALAKVDGLKVAARTSSFSFKGKNLPVDSVGRALKVAHVLEGSVRKSGDRLRITALLINARDGYHLWSETYDAELKDVFQVQDEISRAIVQQLRLRLAGGQAGVTLAKQETSSPEAHAAYLEGLYLLNQSTRASLDRAAERFRAATALDSMYARPYAALAETYIQQLGRNFASHDRIADAEIAVRKAIALDPDLAEAYAPLGDVYRLRMEWDRAESAFREGLRMSPNSAKLIAAYARFLRYAERLDDADREYRRALALDPVSIRTSGALAYNLFFQRRYREAIEQARHTLSIEPNHQLTRYILGRAYAETGQLEQGLALVDSVRIHERDRDLLLDLANMNVRAGRVAEARRYLQEAEQAKVDWPSMFACVWLGLGDRERAFRLLEEGAARQPWVTAHYITEACFDPVRSDPRFLAIRQRLRMP